MDVNLVMFTEKGERKAFPLLSSGILIGRHEDCALRIPLSEVSRKHTQVLIQRGAVLVKDLGSANGTYVNNKRINELKLNPGDRLVIGPVVFTVQIDGDPAEISPVKTKLEHRRSGPPVASAAETSSPASGDQFFDDKETSEDPISTLEAMASDDSRAGLSGSFFLDDLE